jgi:aminopeptidase N
MVMKHLYGEDAMRRFLKYELDNYLRRRGGVGNEEQPLERVENQQYIHYNKGALAMYALRDWIGERKVNGALRGFLDTWRFRGPPYPTSDDLVRRLRDAAPDSLKPAVDDLFRRVTLWDNAAVSASARRVSVPGDSLDEEQYDVTLTVRAGKAYADSLGDERAAPLDDWVDLGVYSGNVLVYLYKEHITKSTETFTIPVDAPPDSAGIDPEHKLIDRDLHDNVRRVRWPPAPRARAPARPRRR